MNGVLSERAKQFVVQAAVSALISVELCLLATEKASPGATRDLAVAALDVHCTIATAVVEAALHLGIAIPADFDEDHKEAMHLLLASQGEDFDRTFMEMLIREDEGAYFFHAGEAMAGTNSELAEITARALPALQEQLSALRSILTATA